MKQNKTIVDICKEVIELNKFKETDVNFILKSPFCIDKENLIKKVSLSKRERKIYKYYYIDGLTNEVIADKLRLDVRQISRIKTDIQTKCFVVWQYDFEAVKLISELKLKQLNQTCLEVLK